MIGCTDSMRSVFLLCVFCAAFQQVALTQHSEHALRIRDKISQQALQGVTVTCANDSFHQISDSLGLVSIPIHLLRSNTQLIITSVGYKPIRIEPDSYLERVLELERDETMLDRVVVSGAGPIRSTQMGMVSISAREASLLPAILGETDILRNLQLKPGIANAGEGLAGFYVRGGGADQNLILIDNAPVYNPNHLLGLFGAFNIEAVSDVRLYKAAFPVEYSGRLSSVVDVRMRKASMDSSSVSGGLGLISSRVSIQTPIAKGRSSIMISGRRTYFDLFTDMVNRAFEKRENFDPIPAYHFSDLNLRFDQLIDERNSIWASFYTGIDKFRSPPQTGVETRFTWGNQVMSVNWQHKFNRAASLTSTVFRSAYNYQMQHRIDESALALRSGIETYGFKVVLDRKSNGTRWQAGVDGMLHNFRVGNFVASNQLDHTHAGNMLRGNEAGVFVSGEKSLTDQLTLRAGLRASGYVNGGRVDVNLEPRLSAMYSINALSAFKASYTRMYQYIHLASLNSASLPTDIWHPSTDATRPEFADQYSIGYTRTIGHRYSFSLESYYKQLHNQVEFRDGAQLFGNPEIEKDFVYGEGRAYGVEVYTERKSGRTTGWIGYTLSWADRRFAEINNGEPFRPRFDRRHDISFVFMHRLNHRLNFSGSWVFGTGAWTTVPEGRFVLQDQAGRQTRSITPVYSRRGNFQLNPVHRLDLSLVLKLKSRWLSQEVAFSLYNAYSRRNPLYIEFNEVNDTKGYVLAIEPRLVSLFPILPGVSYNFKM